MRGHDRRSGSGRLDQEEARALAARARRTERSSSPTRRRRDADAGAAPGLARPATGIWRRCSCAGAIFPRRALQRACPWARRSPRARRRGARRRGSRSSGPTTSSSAGRKVAGILAERPRRGGRPRVASLAARRNNVAVRAVRATCRPRSRPKPLTCAPSGLRAGRGPHRELLAALAGALTVWYPALGRGRLLDRAGRDGAPALCRPRGRRVRVPRRAGGRRVRGTSRATSTKAARSSWS